MSGYLEMLEYRREQIDKENLTIIDIWSKLSYLVMQLDTISYHENAEEAKNFSNAIFLLIESFDKTYAVEEKIKLQTITKRIAQ